MFFDGESSPIILHFITGLKLLIFHKVDKQLSIISLNRGEAMGTNTRLERLETTLDGDTLTRRYKRGMRRDQYPRVCEAISQPVRQCRCTHAHYRTRFRSNKIDRRWAQLFGSYRSRRVPTC